MAEAIADRATVYRLAIPLRRPLDHATGRCTHAEPVVVAVELRDGTVGWGEAPSPAGASGDTCETVAKCVREVYVPALASFHANNFAEALEQIDAMPWHDAHGRPAPAARAAVELALLDASLQRYGRTMDDAVRWMDLPGFGRPGSLPGIRFTAVIDSTDRRWARRLLRSYRWRGFRSYKLTVGFPGDRAILLDTLQALRAGILRHRRSLRLEANAEWNVAHVEEFLAGIDPTQLEGIEQPLPRGHEAELVGLKRSCRVPIIHDESVANVVDARHLIELGVADGFNVGIAKCGGLLPALRVAHLGMRAGAKIILGAMPDETGVLAGAGLAFLDVCPVVAAEGCVGRRRLRDDLARPPRQSGIGGRAPLLAGSWGAGLDSDALQRWSSVPPERVFL